jgi:RecA/RadA recombinase
MSQFNKVPKAKPFSGRIDNYADINKFLSEFDKGGSLLKDFNDFESTEFLDTGNCLLNALWSGSIIAGAPNNKIVTIAGDPKTGKSFLLFNIMKSFQENGYFLYYFETENSPTKKKLIYDFGIKEDQCRVSQPETANEITVFVAKLTQSLLQMKKEGKQLPKIALFLDSYNGLLGAKQLDDALKGDIKVDMGSAARELKLLMNLASTRLGKCGIPLYGTAHIYERDSISGNGMKEKVISGGMGSIYFSSIITYLRKRPDYEESSNGKEKTGVIVIAETFENRFVAPFKKVEIKINFNKGMNKFLGLDNFATVDNCGVGRGKFVEYFDLPSMLISKKKLQENNYDKQIFSYKECFEMSSKDKQEYFYENLKENIKNGRVYVVGGNLPSKNSKELFDTKLAIGCSYKADIASYKFAFGKDTSPEWAVAHLGVTVPTKSLFKKEIWNDDVLLKLDKVIRPFFEYGGKNELEQQETMSEDEINNSLSELESNGLFDLD